MSPPLDAPDIVSLDELQYDLPLDVRNHLSAQYSVLDRETSSDGQHATSHLDRMLGRLKTSPADTCCRVNFINSSVEEVVKGLGNHMSSPGHTHEFRVQRHAAIDDLVMIRAIPGTLQSKSGTADEPLFNCKVPPNPKRKNIFPNWPARANLGWPMSLRAVIVDRFCGEAVLRGANIFVRGILSADAGIRSWERVAVYADLRGPNSKAVPRGLVLEHYSGRCVFIGMGVSNCKRSEYFSQTSGVGVEMRQIAGSPQPSMNGFISAKMLLQNLPSITVAHALDPQPGDTILDMCCAPGGKTTHVASLIKNNGVIIACDKSRKKIISARETFGLFGRMGATCITPLALDSTKAVMELENGQRWMSPRDIIQSSTCAEKDGGLLDVKGFYPNSFDRILLDPPCSALGLRPKLLIDAQSSKALTKFADYQSRFVRNAVQLLKPGGILTYSTCTINASENEDIVKHILTEYPCMKLVPIAPELPGLPGLPGRGLTEEECQMVRRFDPSDDADTMGFFLAKFEKKAS